MQTVKLNLTPGSVLPVVNVSQYDEKRQFALQVYEGATAYSLSGKSVQIRGTKPDGNGFAYDAADGVVSVSGNTVTISTTQQMTAVGGQTMAELRITSGDTILGTLNFIMDCEPSALADDVPLSETDIPVIERNLEAALAEAEADALVAEGWAKGTQNGEPVSSGTYYQDNAEYYKEQAANRASDADAEALKAEGFAVGEQDGTPVTSGSPYYENNAEYYAQRAAASVAQGTQVDFYTQNGHLYVRQTVQGVPQTPVDLGPVGGASNLADLSDVALSSLANQQGLVYNSTSHKWENKYVLLKDGSVAADNLTIGARASGSTVGTNSFAQGSANIASNYYSHASGGHAEATGYASHAEGEYTTASEVDCHAEGNGTTADAQGAHAEGYSREKGTSSIGIYAGGQGSHAEGRVTSQTAFIRATGAGAHAEGVAQTDNKGNLASGDGSHAEGTNTTASGFTSHAEGSSTTASRSAAHAEGSSTTASGSYSHAEGYNTTASGDYSHAEGFCTTAGYANNHAQGHYNKDMSSGSVSGTSGNAMAIGNGTVNALSNAFRVTFAGQVYGLSAFNSSGADYAEFFEWEDGNEENEDRVGYFVTLSGDKIKKATAGDYILGIISGQPSVIGNGDEDWLGRWQRDDFGRFIWGEIEEEDPTTNEKQKVRTILANPAYDNTQEYIERKDRKEWDCVGMLGALAVRDNGKCKVNGFCECGKDGIAVPAETGYRVIARVSKNVVKVIFK
jgi:hypothetical protein